MCVKLVLKKILLLQLRALIHTTVTSMVEPVALEWQEQLPLLVHLQPVIPRREFQAQ